MKRRRPEPARHSCESGKLVPHALMQAEYARVHSDPIGLSFPNPGILDSRFRGKDVWEHGGFRADCSVS